MARSRASAALMQRIADTAVQLLGEDDCYVATTPTSAPILAEHIDVLADPEAATSDAQALRAAVELSQVVDYVQDGTPVFDWQRVGQTYVSDVYRAMMGNVRFARAPLSGEALEDFQRAEQALYDDPPFIMTEAYEQYAELKSEVLSSRAELALRRADLTSVDDEAQRQALTDQIAAEEELLQQKQQLLEALDQRHRFEDALRIYRSAQLIDVPRSVREAMGNVDAGLLDLHDGQETHVRALFTPNRLTEERWITLRIHRSDIQDADANNPLVPDAPAGDGVAPLDDDAIDMIELDIQLLNIQRPWCWEGLFGNRMWKWHVEDEPVSTGGPEPTGKIPAYAAALIVARNLRVSGREKLAATTAIGKNTSIQFATFRLAAPTKIKTGQVVRLATRVQAVGQLSSVQKQSRKKGSAPPARVSRDAAPGRIMTSVSTLSPKLKALRSRMIMANRRSMRLTVQNDTGAAVAGATVQVAGVAGEVPMVKATSPTGDVSFTIRRAADRTVTVTKRGYLKLTQTVRFTPGGRHLATLRRQLKVAATVVVPPVGNGGVMGPFKVGPRAPTPAPSQHSLTIELGQQGDADLEPIDVPVRVEVRNQGNKWQHALTVEPGKDAVFSLPRGRYTVTAYCDVYDVVGASEQAVDLTQDQDRKVSFTFRSRTILRSDETYLLGFVCRRVPKAPDPHSDARW